MGRHLALCNSRGLFSRWLARPLRQHDVHPAALILCACSLPCSSLPPLLQFAVAHVGGALLLPRAAQQLALCRVAFGETHHHRIALAGRAGKALAQFVLDSITTPRGPTE